MKKIPYLFLVFCLLNLSGTAFAAWPFSKEKTEDQVSRNNWELFKAATLKEQEKILGWCSSSKADSMMEVIYTQKPEICVEVGSFVGASLFPVVSGLKYLNCGIAYAIDPYDNTILMEGNSPLDTYYKSWMKVNMSNAFKELGDSLMKWNLNSYCYILRMRASEAVKNIKDHSIGFLHLDGNHSEVILLNDVQNFLPKMKKGGYICLSDSDWPSAQKAIELLKQSCTVDITELDYMFFIKK